MMHKVAWYLCRGKCVCGCFSGAWPGSSLLFGNNVVLAAGLVKPQIAAATVKGSSESNESHWSQQSSQKGLCAWHCSGRCAARELVAQSSRTPLCPVTSLRLIPAALGQVL